MQKKKITSSIARQLNIEFWIREFLHFFVVDILILICLIWGFCYYSEKQVKEDDVIRERYLAERVLEYEKITVWKLDSWKNLYYVIDTEMGESYVSSVTEYIEFLIYPMILIGGTEALILLVGLFKTRKIRRTLKPLNEMAKKAEKLSALVSSQDHRFVNLEQAISNIRPDEPDAKIRTGDKELQSLEIAINNLLQRMRDTYKQQNRFVSDASHELRTPIAVIEGYVNMLDRWGKEDESILKESIEALKNESHHMKNLVEQLLFLARGDSGRNHLNMEEFLFTDMVREVYEEALMIDEKHLYHFEGKEGICFCGDMAMLKQSLRIFADNAAKYSKEGNTILFQAQENENEICYSVQDEGMGMTQAEVSHVFERFYRSDHARNSKSGGTGLGLSIAKWIVDAHEGQIEILSIPEFGTRFTVKLPKKITKETSC